MNLSIVSLLLIILALVIGGQQSGAHVAAFSANSYKTRSMYVSDSGYGLNFYIELLGHENELHVWSAKARRGLLSAQSIVGTAE